MVNDEFIESIVRRAFNHLITGKTIAIVESNEKFRIVKKDTKTFDETVSSAANNHNLVGVYDYSATEQMIKEDLLFWRSQQERMTGRCRLCKQVINAA